MSSDFLFARPSFFRGLGRVFDPFGVPEPYNWSPTPEAADARGMLSDWATVGSDLQSVFDAYPIESFQVVNAPDQLTLFDGGADGLCLVCPPKANEEASRR